jgi:two-component system chemotaxis response regulator CheB
MKIAVVDDSKFTRMVIKQIVNDLSNTVFCWEAENGKVALEKNTRHPVDLIISDLEMPVLDGLQLLKTVIGGEAKTKCLLISAFHKSNQPKIIDALKAGAIGFIEKNSLGKGFDINSLKKEIDKYINFLTQDNILKKEIRSISLESNLNKSVINNRADIISIIGSAGSLGPIEKILEFTSKLEVPIVIGIHIPLGVENMLINRFRTVIDEETKSFTFEGPIQVGKVVLLRGGYNAKFIRNRENIDVEYEDLRTDSNFTPNLDNFLLSAHWIDLVSDVIVLSGLCNDGRRGVREHFRRGGSIYVQSPETSVARTMPLAIIDDGCHSVVSDPESIGKLLQEKYSTAM